MKPESKTANRECPHCHGSLERYEDPLAVKMLGDEIELAESVIQERDALALKLADMAASLDRCANAWNTNQDVPYWVWQSMRQLADKALAKPL